MENPLIKFDALPAFDRIEAGHIVPAIDHLLNTNRGKIEQLLQSGNEFSWGNFIQPMEDMDDQLNRAWSPISHLHSVRDNEELRKAYNECIGKLSDYATELGQNEPLCSAFRAIADQGDGFDTAQRKVLENALRDFHLSG
ncbi:MAG: oligopeptidase A, partial [Thiotrichales bacterium]|nr:oligopeptidase A [Thiotrichales bacterium]